MAVNNATSSGRSAAPRRLAQPRRSSAIFSRSRALRLNTGANVSGRVLARNGSVTMDTNTVAPTACGVPQAGPIPPTVGKAFNPAIIESGGTSTLTITLSNAGATDATGASITDTLPAGVFINGPAATTCVGGTVDTGISSVTLTGGVIPAGGSCTVMVPVTSANGGLHTNTLGIGALQSSNGPNGAAAFADLNVLVPNSPPTLVKGFNPGTINAGGVSTLIITLSSTNGQAAELSVPLIDNLPAGVFVAASPGVVNTCGGAVTAIPGAATVTLSAAAAIPPNGLCSVRVNVTAPGAANYLNVLAAGALQTNRGNNAAPAMATLVVVPVIVQPPGNTPGLSLSKTANPATYTSVGQVIVYTYVVKNTGNVTLTGPFTVNDDKLGLLGCGGPGDLAPGATVTCTATYAIQASDLGDESSLPQGITATIDTGSWLSFKNRYAGHEDHRCRFGGAQRHVSMLVHPGLRSRRSAQPAGAAVLDRRSGLAGGCGGSGLGQGQLHAQPQNSRGGPVESRVLERCANRDLGAAG